MAVHRLATVILIGVLWTVFLGLPPIYAVEETTTSSISLQIVTPPNSKSSSVSGLSHPFVLDLTQSFKRQTVISKNAEARLLSVKGELLASASPSSPAELMLAIKRALTAANRPIPKPLALVCEELEAGKLTRASFIVQCYNNGEPLMGTVPGVFRTRGGAFKHDMSSLSDDLQRKMRGFGREVVDVYFDPNRVTYEDLLKQARKLNCIGGTIARDPEQYKATLAAWGQKTTLQTDQAFTKEINKVFLNQSGLKNLPMTELQAIRVNYAVSRHNKTGLNPDEYLFPCQIALKKELIKSFKLEKATGGRHPAMKRVPKIDRRDLRDLDKAIRACQNALNMQAAP